MTQIKNRAVYEKVLNAMLKNGLVAEGDEDGGCRVAGVVEAAVPGFRPA